MKNKAPAAPLKIIAMTLVLCLFLQEFSYAAPELLKNDIGSLIQGREIKQKNLQWAKNFLPSIPESVAAIDDAWQSPVSKKTLILIQDAHTNASCQSNESKLFDILFENHVSDTVYTEGAKGNVNLTFLRDKAPLSKRQLIAREFMQKGLLHGVEYLDLTSEHQFKIEGVEDPELYFESLKVYKQSAGKREAFEAYLGQIESAVGALEPKILNPFLLAFLKKAEKAQSGETGFSDYLSGLYTQSAALKVDLSRFTGLNRLNDLKRLEDKIDFKAADLEQRKAVESLSAEDQRELSDVMAVSKISMKESQTGYFLRLKEKLKDASRFPELFRYFDYIEKSRVLDHKQILDEARQLENLIFENLTENDDERKLLQAIHTLSFYKKLFSLTLTPQEYEESKEQSFTDLKALAGFLNRQFMNLRDHYDKAVFLKDDFGDMEALCRKFYELTYQRDERFTENIKSRWNETQPTALLITGGYHTPNLKYLLRKSGISFISVIPQVFNETNVKRYEEILLSQPARPMSGLKTPGFTDTDMPAYVGAAAATIPASPRAMQIFEQFGVQRSFAVVSDQKFQPSAAAGARFAQDFDSVINKVTQFRDTLKEDTDLFQSQEGIPGFDESGNRQSGASESAPVFESAFDIDRREGFEADPADFWQQHAEPVGQRDVLTRRFKFKLDSLELELKRAAAIADDPPSSVKHARTLALAALIFDMDRFIYKHAYFFNKDIPMAKLFKDDVLPDLRRLILAWAKTDIATLHSVRVVAANNFAQEAYDFMNRKFDTASANAYEPLRAELSSILRDMSNSGEYSGINQAKADAWIADLARIQKGIIALKIFSPEDYSFTLSRIGLLSKAVQVLREAGSGSRLAASAPVVRTELYSRMDDLRRLEARQFINDLYRRNGDLVDVSKWSTEGIDAIFGTVSGRFVGYQAFKLAPEDREADAKGIRVARAWRGRFGVGVQIREAAIDYLRREGYEKFFVDVDNTLEAQKFHSKWSNNYPGVQMVQYNSGPEIGRIVTVIYLLNEYEPQAVASRIKIEKTSGGIFLATQGQLEAYLKERSEKYQGARLADSRGYSPLASLDSVRVRGANLSFVSRPFPERRRPDGYSLLDLRIGEREGGKSVMISSRILWNSEVETGMSRPELLNESIALDAAVQNIVLQVTRKDHEIVISGPNGVIRKTQLLDVGFPGLFSEEPLEIRVSADGFFVTNHSKDHELFIYQRTWDFSGLTDALSRLILGQTAFKDQQSQLKELLGGRPTELDVSMLLKALSILRGSSGFEGKQETISRLRAGLIGYSRRAVNQAGHEKDSVHASATPILRAAYSPDGESFVFANNGGLATLVNAKNDASRKVIYGNAGQLSSLAFSPDGQTLAIGDDEAVSLYRVFDGKLIRKTENFTGAINHIVFSPDARYLAAANDRNIGIWRVSDGALLQTLRGPTGTIESIAFSPDGTTLAAGSFDYLVRLWKVSDGTLAHTLVGHAAAVHAVAFSPDGKSIVSASGDRTIRLWNTSDGNAFAVINGDTGPFYKVSYSPDGKLIASVSSLGDVSLWKASNGRFVRSLSGHNGGIREVIFSPDSRNLVAAEGSVIRVWRTSNAALLKTLEGHTYYPIHHVDFSSDGRTLFLSSQAGSFLFTNFQNMIKPSSGSGARLAAEPAAPRNNASAAALPKNEVAAGAETTPIVPADFLISVARFAPPGFIKGDLAVAGDISSDVRVFSLSKVSRETLVVLDRSTNRQFTYDTSKQVLIRLQDREKQNLSQAFDLTDFSLKLRSQNKVPAETPKQPTAKVVLVDSFPDIPGDAFYQSLILHFGQTLAVGSQVVFVSQDEQKAQRIAALAKMLGVKNKTQFVSMKKEGLAALDLPKSYLMADTYDLNAAKAAFGQDQKYFRLESPKEKGQMGIYAFTPLGVLMDLISLEQWEQASDLYNQISKSKPMNGSEFQNYFKNAGSIPIPFVSKIIDRMVAQVYIAERALGSAA